MLRTAPHSRPDHLQADELPGIASWEGAFHLVAGDGDAYAEGFGGPGAGEGVGGFDGEVGAVAAGVGARFGPGDAEGACGVRDGGQLCGAAGIAGAAGAGSVPDVDVKRLDFLQLHGIPCPC